VRPIFTASEMRALDTRAIQQLGIPGPRLMEHAGAGAAHVIASEFAPIRGKRVLILCGRGNNGGDGFVVARRLAARGARVRVVLIGHRGEVKGDAVAAMKRWRGKIVEMAGERAVEALPRDLADADVIVDALLGTGLTGPARGLFAAAIFAVNGVERPVVALDLPSGLSSDQGALLGPTVRASLTITFAGYKRGLLLHPGAGNAGRVVVVDIGIAPSDVLQGIQSFLLEETDIRRHFPPRRSDAHKGTFGHLLVVAGSIGKTGAAGLAGRAALRSGVGLCTIATAVSQQPIVAGLGIETMTEPLPETPAQTISSKARERIVELASRTDAVALGPGVSLDPDTQELIRGLIADVPRPMVVDADALSALAGHLDVLDRAAGPRALTPHPGEMARMLGRTIADVQSDRFETVRSFCTQHRVALALKGAGTVIGGPDGRLFVNSTGNPGMAKGGSGDVLTGMAGAFLARGLDALTALQAGCFLHGMAGDLAGTERGEESVLAGDIVESISAAMMGSRATGRS